MLKVKMFSSKRRKNKSEIGSSYQKECCAEVTLSSGKTTDNSHALQSLSLKQEANQSRRSVKDLAGTWTRNPVRTEKNRIPEKLENIEKSKTRSKRVPSSDHQLDRQKSISQAKTPKPTELALLGRIRVKKIDAAEYIKNRGSFWDLGDHLILAVQKKLEARDREQGQAVQENKKSIPKVTEEGLPVSNKDACQRKRANSHTILDAGTKVSHGYTRKNKQTHKNAFDSVLHSEASAEVTVSKKTQIDLTVQSIDLDEVKPCTRNSLALPDNDFGLNVQSKTGQSDNNPEATEYNLQMDIVNKDTGSMAIINMISATSQEPVLADGTPLVCDSEYLAETSGTEIPVDVSLKEILFHESDEELDGPVSDQDGQVDLECSSLEFSSAERQGSCSSNYSLGSRLNMKENFESGWRKDEIKEAKTCVLGSAKSLDSACEHVGTSTMENQDNLHSCAQDSDVQHSGVQDCEVVHQISIPAETVDPCVETTSKAIGKSSNRKVPNSPESKQTSKVICDSSTCTSKDVSNTTVHEETNDFMEDNGQDAACLAKQQFTEGRRKRPYKRKHRLTIAKKKPQKFRDLDISLAKLGNNNPEVGGNLWNMQRSITDQVLTGCIKDEQLGIRGSEISPDVENAASVLAMMRGKLFSSSADTPDFKRAEGEVQNDRDFCEKLTAPRGIWQQEGMLMCELCGQVFSKLGQLKDHMRQHASDNQFIHEQRLSADKSDTTLELLCTGATTINGSTTCTTLVNGNTSLSDSELVELLSTQCSNQLDTTRQDFKPTDCPKTCKLSHPKTCKLSRCNSISNVSQIGVSENGILSHKSVRAVNVKTEVSDSSSEKCICDLSVGNEGTSGLSLQLTVARKQLEKNSGLASEVSESLNSSENKHEGETTQNKILDKETCSQMSELAENSSLKRESNDELVSNEVTELPNQTTREGNSAAQSISIASETDLDLLLSEVIERTSVLTDSKATLDIQSGEVKNEVGMEANCKSKICSVCGRSFSSVANMRKHIRMQHHSYRPHKCLTCGKGFPYPSSLEEHQMKHLVDPKKLLVCDVCGKSFTRASGLRKHVKEHHEDSRPYICHICHKGYIYLYALRDHLRSHSEERAFKCKQCESVFKHASNLQTHIKKLHETTCKCPTGSCVCERKTQPTVKALNCVICFKTYYGKKQLGIHMRIHGEVRHLVCKVCKKKFPNKFLLTKHRMKHQETKTFTCDICQRVFLSKQSLKIHVLVHVGTKPFQCENCGKQYSTKNSLKIHSLLHLESQPFGCCVCDKTFTNQANLSKHIATHSKDQVFVCSHCSVRFESNAELKKHVLLHDEQKKYVCSFCSKRFLHESNLKMHIVRHTGERPHSCDVCGRCFSLKANLRRHKQVHQKKNGHICAESAVPIPGAYVILGLE